MKVPLERVSTAAKTYLSAIGAVAIYIGVDKGRPINVGVARDLDKALRHLQKIISPTAIFGWIAWGTNYDALSDIARRMFAMPGDMVTLDLAAAAIETAAQVRGITLTPHIRAIERAEVYAGYLDEAIAAMQRNSTFSAFNHAYKLHRQTLARKGESAQPYWSVMAELRAVIIRALIAEPKNRLVPASVITEIRKHFPWFTKPVLLSKKPKTRSKSLTKP